MLLVVLCSWMGVSVSLLVRQMYEQTAWMKPNGHFCNRNSSEGILKVRTDK